MKNGAKIPENSEILERQLGESFNVFKYPEAVRRLIYTTNTIEGFNRQLREGHEI